MQPPSVLVVFVRYCCKLLYMSCLIINIFQQVLDFWWQKDAPNCYRKEIVTIMEDEKEPDPNMTVDVSVQTEDETIAVVEENSNIGVKSEEIIINENTIEETLSENYYGKPFFISIVILFVTLVYVYHML